MEKVLLKDILFNETKVTKIAVELYHAYPPFKRDAFVRAVVSKFPELELKARISWITQCLKGYLPPDYPHAVSILIKALPAPNNPHLSDDDFGDFIYAPYAEYIAKNGCTKEYLYLSLNALYEITQRFSAEDAIRYFIDTFPQETLETLLFWTKDQHYHVRRLCSEGTRPKLPWSQKINIPVTAALPILDNLFFDKTRFVTRSVANHINDISKVNPDLSLEILTKWQKLGTQKREEMDYIIRHGLRTLVKQGNPKAMKMLGFDHSTQIRLSKFIVPKQIKMNTVLAFSFILKSKEDANAIVDYIIYFQNKAGKLNSRKVFKLTKISIAKNKSVLITKRQILREHMTTRTLYSGKHKIAIQINGNIITKKSFMLG